MRALIRTINGRSPDITKERKAYLHGSEMRGEGYLSAHNVSMSMICSDIVLVMVRVCWCGDGERNADGFDR